MLKTIPIELDRGSANKIFPQTSIVNVTGPFKLAFKNEGAGTHLHISVSESLQDSLTIQEQSTYIKSGSIWSTKVCVGEVDQPTTGSVNITIGHGVERQSIVITIE